MIAEFAEWSRFRKLCKLLCGDDETESLADIEMRHVRYLMIVRRFVVVVNKISDIYRTYQTRER